MKIKAVTLLELLIALALMSLVVLASASIEVFSRHTVINSDRKAQVQNEITSVLEHIGKNVKRAVGDQSAPPASQPLQLIGAPVNGFKIQVDPNTPVTPGNYQDDIWLTYTLTGNNLTFGCQDPNVGMGAACPSSETLSTHIIPGVVAGRLSDFSLAGGFFVYIEYYGSLVEVGLQGRYDPNAAASRDNPQVNLKSRFLTRSSSLK